MLSVNLASKNHVPEAHWASAWWALLLLRGIKEFDTNRRCWYPYKNEGITRAVVTKKWRSWRVCIQNEDVHIARNSYFKFNTPKLVISYWNESLVVPSFLLSSASSENFPLRYASYCNFPLKWVPGCPFFPIERQRCCRVHIWNEDVHKAKNSYLQFNI